ncbi:RHS repeat-associated protein [Variovorax boronicumulans]|uniref:RHS repeat-associated core domain-containing protein n=1 Tax=Variovorax boronicumulans TaxID=436515 RepID=UPI002781104B|nr:RHS repeat-associated core domain-containing protein [Variovorax boronicumulans]MDQ0081663.1 RHS repeat-associated protein [Variovorax boronicumulans]
MSDALWAAREGDPLLHTSFWADLVSGALEFTAYAAAGALACAVTGLTCGVGAVVLGAVVGAALSYGAGDKITAVCDEIGNALFPPSEQAWIRTGSPDTRTNAKPAARAAGMIDPGASVEPSPAPEPSFLDKVGNFFSQMWKPTVASPDPRAVPCEDDKIDCEKHPPMEEQYLAEGSSKVYINSQPAVRSKDRSTCEATVSDNAAGRRVSHNVRIGGPPVVVREIRSGKTPGIALAITALMLLRGNPRNLLRQLPCMAIGMGASVIAGQAMNAAFGSPRPVHAPTGAKVLGEEDELDFSLPGMLPIEWQRFYNSRDARTGGLFGVGWSVPFEVEIVRDAHPDGGEQFVYIDEQGRRLGMGQVSAPDAFFNAGEGLAFRRAEDGRMVVESMDGIHRLFEQDPHDDARLRLVLVGDRNENILQLRYDEQGRLCGVEEQEGPSRIALFHSATHPRRVERIETVPQDGGQRVVLARYDYDAAGDLAQVVDATGKVVRRFAYDAGRRMTMHELPTGLRSHYEWTEFAGPRGAEWRVTRYWSDLGDEYRFEYDLAAGLTVAIDGLGRRVEREWDAAYQIVRHTDALGHTWRFEWNDDGQVLGAVDPKGGQWRCSYDASGNLTGETDPLGRTESSTWLEFASLPLTEVDAAGRAWRYVYDEHGNLVAEIDPLGQRTVYAHGTRGEVVRITDATGKHKHLRWDERGLLREHIDCSGQRTRFAWDAMGHLQSVTDAIGETTHYQHDARGRLRQVLLPDGRIERYERDRAGLLHAFTNPAGHVTAYRRDAGGEVCERLDPMGRRVRFDHDAYGRLIALHNENGQAYRFDWDEGDRLRAQTDIDGSERRYRYDALSQVTEVAWIPAPPDATDAHDDSRAAGGAANEALVEPGDEEPIVHRLERDAVGRLLARNTGDTSISYRWDAADQLLAIEQTSAQGVRQCLGFAYDALGRLTDESSAGGALRHSYDELGNLLSTRLPDGRSINRLYYGSGHLHQVNIDGKVISDFERDGLHREVLRSQGRIATATGYDRAGRLAHRRQRLAGDPGGQAPASGLLDKTYGYDFADNLIVRARRRHGGHGGLVDLQGRGVGAGGSLPPERRQSLRYDATGRILQAQYHQANPGVPAETFRYDQAANLLDGDGSTPGTGSSGYVRNNRLRVYQDKRYEWDRFGRLLCKRIGHHTVQRFRYDSEHRLVAVDIRDRQGESIVRFEYDPIGRRTAKTHVRADGHVLGTTEFLWDGMRLAGEHSASQHSLYLYTAEDSYEPLARVDGLGAHQEVLHFHTDANGAPEEMTGADGQLLWQTRYRVWGNTVQEEYHPAQLAPQNLRFQGQYLDRETGLHYNTFRFFDPDVGRFTTSDPIGLAGGLNLYQYAPNPVEWIDPWGWVCGKAFNRRNRITSRWVKTLTGKKPGEVDAFLRQKGYTPSVHQTSPTATPHTRYTRVTKAGSKDVLDYHPGGPNAIHKSDYWKVYRDGQVQGRIGHGGFTNYNKIVDSPVYVDGILMNTPI